MEFDFRIGSGVKRNQRAIPYLFLSQTFFYKTLQFVDVYVFLCYNDDMNHLTPDGCPGPGENLIAWRNNGSAVS